jgi:hypothetical protein
VWFWQSSLNSWARYSDFENGYIEEAYQRKDTEIKLNGTLINLKLHIQFNSSDDNSQRSINPLSPKIIFVETYSSKS